MTAEKGGNFVAMDVAGADVGGLSISGHAYSCRHLDGDSPSQTPGAPASPPPSAAERLLRLKELLEKGLITQEEYDKRRQEILKSL
jgi:hypothetical protein